MTTWHCAACGYRVEADEKPDPTSTGDFWYCPKGTKHTLVAVEYVPDMGLCPSCGQRLDSRDHTHCKYGGTWT